MGRDYKDHLIGSTTGVATAIPVGTVPVLLAAASGDRVALSISADVAGAALGIASNFTATSKRLHQFTATYGEHTLPLPYKGDVYGKTEGATGLLHIFDVRPAGG